MVTGGDPLGPSYFTSEDAGSGFVAEGLPGSEASHSSNDVLAYGASGHDFVETLSARRIHSTSTHGTGCAFSTAIACELARGESIPVAVSSAKAFVRRAIERAPGLGLGRGPMGLSHT